MNILGMFPAFRPPGHAGPVGGGEISNRQLLGSLASRGHRVTVFAFNAGTGVESHSRGVEVLDGGLGRSSVAEKATTAIRGRRGLNRRGCQHAPDVVLASPSTVGAALKLAKRWGAPVAVLVRARQDMQGFSGGAPMRNVARRLIYGSSHWSDAPFLIANSRFLLELCHNEGFQGQGWVVYPPIDVEVSNSDWPSEIRKIGMIGSSREKGVETFLELANRMPRIRFVVIGDRSVPPGETITSGNVTRMGWTNDPVRAIDDCDAILMPTRHGEAFGRAAVEAICRKKFVVASRVDGLPEAVTVDHLLVAPLDIESWCQKVSELVRDPAAFVPSMSIALEATGSFGLEEQATTLERTLFEIVASGRKG